MPKAVIAVVPGWAVGGGHSLHVVCDLTLASKEHAIFKQTDADVTSFDGGYGSAYLAKMVGQKKAREIFFLGREYIFGEKDCFEAMRDYLKTKNITIPPRIPFEDNWFDKDLDYFSPDVVKEWGGQEVSIKDIQENDVITFSVHSKVANHCGVYLKNDIFYHHAVQRLSCRENLYPFWVKFIDRVYRYAT